MADHGYLQPDPGSAILGFIRHLRAAEFDVTVEDAALIGRTLSELSGPDLPVSKAACRAICCRDREHWQRFDALFEAYWFSQAAAESGTSNEIEAPSDFGGGGISGIGSGADPFDAYARDTAIGGGAGRQATIAKADFRFLNDMTPCAG